ncbi:MAG: (deoxy)nucleoside triphosphate pyrophosphohydrolase [Opitutaceae bacterium]
MKVPMRVACALIERDGKLLVAQRPSDKSQPHKWEFPGGKLEAGETGAEALVREIREELGVSIDIGAALPEVTHDYGAFAITLLPFICALQEGEVAPREHVAVRWCRAAEIEQLDLAAADVPVLRLYLEVVTSE